MKFLVSYLSVATETSRVTKSYQVHVFFLLISFSVRMVTVFLVLLFMINVVSNNTGFDIIYSNNQDCWKWPNALLIDCIEFVGNSPTKVQRNNLLNEQNIIKELGPEYSIRLEIKFNSWKHGWRSIFRFTAVDGNCCELGQRIPSLWTKKSSTHQIFLRED